MLPQILRLDIEMYNINYIPISNLEKATLPQFHFIETIYWFVETIKFRRVQSKFRGVHL